ncbi:glycogen/starch synthase [Shewanella eurypsychrophilus]|uniref:starch synthase n=1 Tax=Shewanella eurypsychrophilus TaxID=2593656 RepID=A0ABX6VCD7_9GAMM|nr:MULTISPECIES: glycogen/starch synthase [Shewanella]QFU25220.1 glycosyltransferase [Shewanella sp. YLB-09]QPG60369.1 glycogen/starch synthase [Shewanella eurypsychrophilus]
MLAAENGSIPRAKVGGMADVIRDLPAALAQQGVMADVIMPSYGFLAGSVNATKLAEFSVDFGGARQSVALLTTPHPDVEGAVIYFIDVQDGVCKGKPQEIYSQGSDARPFAEDANKFALFCLCVATAINEQVLPMPDLIHLHDWHCAMFALLAQYDEYFQNISTIPCVYTIHNLAIQGIRPLRDDASSMSAWYPGLLEKLSSEQFDSVIDPRYPHCINPMRVGINLCAKVHLVSPTYADEVLHPSDHHAGFFGGEGLEADLQRKQDSGALVGILNACVYGAAAKKKVSATEPNNSQDKCREDQSIANKDDIWLRLLEQVELALLRWQGDKQWVASCDLIALTRIASLWRCGGRSKDMHSSHLQSSDKKLLNKPLMNKMKSPSMLVTSVGRLTDQKVLILRQTVLQADGQRVTVLESILQALALAHPEGLFILLGSGDAEIAGEFSAIAARYANFIFLNGYDEAVSDALYQNGDLFMMPSSFEPCGISQMLAMKAGQICLVHGVGGLRDTVADNETGYLFSGNCLAKQAENLQLRFSDALEDFNGDKWRAMEQLASQQRFDWFSSAAKYKRQLYCFD